MKQVKVQLVSPLYVMPVLLLKRELNETQY